MAAAERTWPRLGVVALAWVLLAQTPRDPGPPTRLQIEPLAPKRSGTLQVLVDGISQGESVRIQVLQDCNGDSRPDAASQGGCKNPLYERESRKAGGSNQVEDALDFAVLDPDGVVFPAQQTLWLRASHPGSKQFVQSFFLLEAPACTALARFVQLFTRGTCGTAPEQSLTQHRSSVDITSRSFEVRTVVLDSAPTGTPTVPGTRGATGVAWLADGSLLATLGPAPDRPAGGLFRVHPSEGKRERLWVPRPGLVAAAPFQLTPSRVVVAEQGPGPQRPSFDAVEAHLVVLARSRQVQRIPLPYRLHQILAADASHQHLLALSLGFDDSRPVLLAIDLAGAKVEVLPFRPELYLATQRRPGGTESALTWENNLEPFSWQISLFGPDGGWIRDLVKRRGAADLAPTWNSNGTALAFLAELEESR